MAVCFTTTCNCCVCKGAVVNSCCPGECWPFIFLNLQDRFNGCTKSYKLNWNGNEVYGCDGTKGCWVLLGAIVGICTFNFRAKCVDLNPGGAKDCEIEIEMQKTAGPGAPADLCFDPLGITCNPLHEQFSDGVTYPISLACGCADQVGGNTWTITE